MTNEPKWIERDELAALIAEEMVEGLVNTAPCGFAEALAERILAHQTKECPKCKAAREANVKRVQAHRARSKTAVAPTKAAKRAKPSKPKPGEPLDASAANMHRLARQAADAVTVARGIDLPVGNRPFTPRLKQPKKAKA